MKIVCGVEVEKPLKVCNQHFNQSCCLYLLCQFPCGSAGKKICLQCRRPGFNPWVRKIPWRRGRLPTPVFWPGEFHGLYSQWGSKELDRTERLSVSILIFYIFPEEHFILPRLANILAYNCVCTQMCTQMYVHLYIHNIYTIYICICYILPKLISF